MESFILLVLTCIAGFFAWRFYQAVRANPELLSRDNLSKSFLTTGLLALGLIAFVAFLVVLLQM